MLIYYVNLNMNINHDLINYYGLIISWVVKCNLVPSTNTFFRNFIFIFMTTFVILYN